MHHVYQQLINEEGTPIREIERERERGGDCRDRNSVDPIKAHDTFYNLINK